MNKAIFIDKDGTLVKDIPYNVDPRKIQLYPDVPLALHKFKEEGYKIIVITNQPGIAYGYFKEEKIKLVEKEIMMQLKKFNLQIDGFYYCPHHVMGTISKYTLECECRKPKPGMIEKAAKDLNLNLTESWMIGDILNDVEAGLRAGCKSALINNGNETEWFLNKVRIPTLIVSTMKEAAEKISCYKSIHVKEKEENYERSFKRTYRQI
jgi:D,D-heptose 1,7-bisphosphate phosphatase